MSAKALKTFLDILGNPDAVRPSENLPEWVGPRALFLCRMIEEQRVSRHVRCGVMLDGLRVDILVAAPKAPK